LRQYGANSRRTRGRDHAAGIVDGSRELLDLGRVVDEAQVVAQPLDERAGHSDRALERVHRVGVAELPRDGGDQAVLGDHWLGPQREQQEGSGAVRVLDVALVKAGVTEQRRRLVAQDPGHWHAGQGAGGGAVHLAG
jgi:hypothetical protein